MKCFAGERSSFAIDVELTQFGRMPMGKILVWLDGRPVGTHEDDDFSIFGFRTGDHLTILWSLNETTCFSYPDHPAGFLRAMIAADEFTQVMREFEECFSKSVGAGPRTCV